MAEPERWADTEDALEKIANLRKTMESWKSAGYNVSEMEHYLKRSDITEEGFDRRLKELIKRIKEEVKREEQRAEDEREYLFSSDISPKERGRRLKTYFEGIKEEKKQEMEQPGPLKCPTCGMDVKSQWKSCPFCRSSVSAARPPVGAPKPSIGIPAIDKCPKCQGLVEPGDRKCPRCGHRLKPWSLFS